MKNIYSTSALAVLAVLFIVLAMLSGQLLQIWCNFLQQSGTFGDQIHGWRLTLQHGRKEDEGRGRALGPLRGRQADEHLHKLAALLV